MNKKDNKNLQKITCMQIDANTDYMEKLHTFHEMSKTYGHDNISVKEIGIQVLRLSDKRTILNEVLNILTNY